MRLLLVIVCTVGLLTVAACRRLPPPEPAVPTPPPVAVAAPAPPPLVAPPAPPPGPAWPALDREPELAVMLHRDAIIRVRLLVPHRAADGTLLPAGNLDVAPDGDGLRLAGRRLPAMIDLTPLETGRTFTVDGMQATGRLRLARARHQIEAIELVGVEAWLAGVLPVEMHPRWPVNALAAQAIVARSYAAARWQARHGQPWHLLRGTADVAYDGDLPQSPAVAAAIAQTRGLLLVHDGQAVLARFHACSGGRTEDSTALWPSATLVDGRTPLARFSPPVDDPASLEGARALGWTRSHQSWRAAFPVADLSVALGAWSRADRRRPAIGTVHAVAVATRHPSGRVAQVAVTHRVAGVKRTDRIEGNEFRLAAGANRLRSLWWERAVMASAGGGQFVVEGRGFGHGVGLPQVSAWWLAESGWAPERIVALYFPGATVARRWR